MEYNQVYPIGDSKQHVLNEQCKCQPYLALFDGERTLIHNPFDLRDFWEQDKKDINQIYLAYTGKIPAWGKEGHC